MVNFATIVCVVLCCIQATLGDQLTVLNVPSGVHLSNAKEVSISDVQSLPFQLFGFDETQSGLVSDVSFFRRPSLLAVIALSCGDACAEVDAELRAVTAAGRSFSLTGGAVAEPLTYRPTSLADAAASAGLAKSLLAGSADLGDSSHPGLFADAKSTDSLPAGLSDEAALPVEVVRSLRLARALVDRAVASGLLSDSQPDALRIDISTVGLTSANRHSVLEFAVNLANKLADAAGRKRAFVAMATVSSPSVGSAAGAQLIRIGRSLMAAPAAAAAASAGDSMGLAADYNEDFPVMFNLILWLSVVLALAVYAVAYGLWNIDPGKDSIIYRRGYAHAKKD